MPLIYLSSTIAVADIKATNIDRLQSNVGDHLTGKVFLADANQAYLRFRALDCGLCRGRISLVCDNNESYWLS